MKLAPPGAVQLGGSGSGRGPSLSPPGRVKAGRDAPWAQVLGAARLESFLHPSARHVDLLARERAVSELPSAFAGAARRPLQPRPRESRPIALS
jgi:hypothetical protein